MSDFDDITKIRKDYMAKLVHLKIAIEGDDNNKSYKELSKAMAEEEVAYRVAKAKEYLRLKLEGIQVTLIPTMAKGNVGDELLAFKVSEAIFHARRENLKRLHANLDALRSLLSTAKSEMDIR